MIRIVSTKRLAALRAEAAQVPELRDRVAALTSGLDRLNESAEWHSRQAEEARADAERLAGPVWLLDMLLSEDTDAAEAADTGTDTGTGAAS